jgi:hypothetical protein
MNVSGCRQGRHVKKGPFAFGITADGAISELISDSGVEFSAEPADGAFTVNTAKPPLKFTANTTYSIDFLTDIHHKGTEGNKLKVQHRTMNAEAPNAAIASHQVIAKKDRQPYSKWKIPRGKPQGMRSR